MPNVSYYWRTLLHVFPYQLPFPYPTIPVGIFLLPKWHQLISVPPRFSRNPLIPLQSANPIPWTPTHEIPYWYCPWYPWATSVIPTTMIAHFQLYPSTFKTWIFQQILDRRTFLDCQLICWHPSLSKDNTRTSLLEGSTHSPMQLN